MEWAHATECSANDTLLPVQICNAAGRFGGIDYNCSTKFMSRSTPSPEIRELAQRLLAYAAAADNPSEANMPAVLRVSEKLRRTLSLLTGSSGFLSLLTRALTLAKAQVPGLGVAQIMPDGSLEGLSDLGNQDQDGGAGVILIAQLLALLVTFVGERLMRSLVLETWPDFPALDNLEKNDHDPTR